ncbi:porin [Nitrospira sp. Kam-Ns4a]
MTILRVLALSLVLGSAAWAAEEPSTPPESGMPPALQTPAAPEGRTGPPAPPPSARQRLRDLDRRLSVLESTMVGRGHGRGVLERGLGWSPELKERGFFLYSTDGYFRLHLNGGIQADYHAFPFGQRGTDPGTEPDGFVLRRLRPILDFRIGRFVRGQIMPDLAPRRRSELFNVFLDFELSEYARVRVGQFKPVMSIENQQGEFDLVFLERSLVQNFALRRAFGVQLTGYTLQRRLRYDLGVFNSNNGAVGSASVPELSADNGKLGMVRLMATPFLLKGPPALRKLEMGTGVLFGECLNSVCQQPMLTMGQDRIIFQYNGGVTGNGMHVWVLPEAQWFWGRLGMMATFVHTWEPNLNQTTGRTAALQNQAWMVQGEVALTDDEPAFNRITPKTSFDLTKPGHWGALTFAARYSEQQVDPDAFGLNFASAVLYARTARGVSLALNWYMSREIRHQVVYEHTDLFGATPAFATAPTTDLLAYRFTLIY